MYICQILFCFQDPESCGRAALTVVAEIQRGLKRWLSRVRIFEGGFPLSPNFYARMYVNFTRRFIHCLYFIYARDFYLRSHGKITRQWKATLSHLISWWVEKLTLPHFCGNNSANTLDLWKCSVKALSTWPFMHCLYFIYASKFYVRSQGKITRQWKSTLTADLSLLSSASWRKIHLRK